MRSKGAVSWDAVQGSSVMGCDPREQCHGMRSKGAVSWDAVEGSSVMVAHVPHRIHRRPCPSHARCTVAARASRLTATATATGTAATGAAAVGNGGGGSGRGGPSIGAEGVHGNGQLCLAPHTLLLAAAREGESEERDRRNETVNA
ncbi:unnamed protein product [Closterium sp. NIES-54]